MKSFVFTSLMLMLVLNLYTSPFIIKGNVADEITGLPLAGAHVIIPEIKLRTITNENGEFMLQINRADTYKIIVSFIGYETISPDTQINHGADLLFKLPPTIYTSREIVITASRNSDQIKFIPAAITLISADQIKATPHQKVEDILKYSPGVNVYNPAGIYSMRPVVTLRGLGGDEQGRTLVLLDGVPLNKGDTGGVNWSRLNADDVERIEVLHGPGSSIYGNNAMGGVINIITRKPEKPLEGSAKLSYGTYNTLMSSLNVGGIYKNGMYFRASGMYNQSDGYNRTPQDFREEPDYSAPCFLEESSISTKAGWNLHQMVNIEMQYDHFRNRKGEGEKILAPDGEYRHFDTDFFRLNINGKQEKYGYNLNVFYQLEDYFKLDERMQREEYSRFDVHSNRIDKGLNLNIFNKITKDNKLIYGAELRLGSVDGGDYYVTSPDSIVNKGKLDSYAFFIQDEQKLLNDKLSLNVGLRFDYVTFHDGGYISTDGSWTGVLPDLEDHHWTALSPRIGLSFQVSKSNRAYVSWSRGFRASILDDLCRSGWMWVGPKIANPKLGPESIDNFEIGSTWNISESLSTKAAVYYAAGKDFLYYVATGDSLWGKRPIYQRQNISDVSIFGISLQANFTINEAIRVFGNYDFTHSKINQFSMNPELEGMALKYTPRHQLKAGLLLSPKWFDLSLLSVYKSKQFTTDDNQSYIDSNIGFDIKIGRDFSNMITAYLEVLDIFDNQHLDSEFYLSPGRRVNIGISARF